MHRTRLRLLLLLLELLVLDTLRLERPLPGLAALLCVHVLLQRRRRFRRSITQLARRDERLVQQADVLVHLRHRLRIHDLLQDALHVRLAQESPGVLHRGSPVTRLTAHFLHEAADAFSRGLATQVEITSD